jgi:LysM repeat protein|nr:LysM peptidoglycan-binding domain-containing protein [Ligilactobacillus acidipiscis]
MKFKKTLLTVTAAVGMLTAGSLAANADTVTVKAGDTISSIAKENNVSVSSIEAANDLSNINMIYIGQEIEVGKNGQVTSTQPQQQAAVAQTPAKPAQSNQAQPKAQAPVQQKVVQPQQTSQGQVQPQQAQTKVVVQQAASQPATTSNNSGSSSEAAAKAAIAGRESGGSYSASNGQYYGKYQLSKSMLNGDLSEANQEKTADNYVNSRYGSWSNALKHSDQYGWY